LNVAMIGPADGRNTLVSLLQNYCKCICAEAEITEAERIGSLPDLPWNLAFVYTNDEDFELFVRFRKAYPDCCFILWSEDQKWARAGIRLHSVGFFRLPVTESQFVQTMRLCSTGWMTGMKTVKGVADSQSVRIRCMDIRYAKADGHSCVIYTKSDHFSVNMSLSSLETLSGDCFVRCHRSIIANIRYLSDISPDGIVLTDGRKLSAGTEKLIAEAQEKVRRFHMEVGAFLQEGVIA